MSRIWTSGALYRRVGYESEVDLESSIIEVQKELFGPKRIYLDVKRKIGAEGGLRNIPDGYLIDLTGREPRLFVVENELAVHEPLKHIAVQILEFSLSCEAEPRKVKTVLFSALQDQPKAREQCDAYAKSHEYRNLDHLLEKLVFDTPFAALVIIDEVPESLESVLAKKFQFGTEVIELVRYENQNGDRFYRFDPFLGDIEEDIGRNADAARPAGVLLDTSEIDTVVVPARDEGFKEVFLGENRWHQIRLHGSMRPQIKYIAVYRVAPMSAITHVAPVKSIEPWKNGDKYVVNFAEPAHEIGPISYVKGGRVKHLQNLRYTTHKRLEAARTLDDVW